MPTNIKFNVFNVNEDPLTRDYLNLDAVDPEFLSGLATNPHAHVILRQNVNEGRSTITLNPERFTNIAYLEEDNIATATASLEEQQIVFLSCSTPEEGQQEHFEKIAARVAEFAEESCIIIGTDLDFPHNEAGKPLAKILTDIGFRDIDHDWSAYAPLGTQKRGSIFVKVPQTSSGYFTRPTYMSVALDTAHVYPRHRIDDKTGSISRIDKEKNMAYSSGGPAFVQTAGKAQLPSYIVINYTKMGVTPAYSTVARVARGTWNMLNRIYV